MKYWKGSVHLTIDPELLSDKNSFETIIGVEFFHRFFLGMLCIYYSNK